MEDKWRHGGFMTEAKIIKRYQNRKLYDSETSVYVTFDQLEKTLKSGRDLKVIDNQTKNDITATTLTQLMHEKERKSSTVPSVDLLLEIIRHGDGTFSGYIQGLIANELAKFDDHKPPKPLMDV